MKPVQAIYPVLGAVLIVLATVLPVFAAGIVIDGDGSGYIVSDTARLYSAMYHLVII